MSEAVLNNRRYKFKLQTKETCGRGYYTNEATIEFRLGKHNWELYSCQYDTNGSASTGHWEFMQALSAEVLRLEALHSTGTIA